MAEASDSIDASATPFIEVNCKVLGKTTRFAAGTKAGFALYSINRRLDPGIQQAWYIEAVKDGEEPVCFGPNAVLVNYGKGWMLQTFHGPNAPTVAEEKEFHTKKTERVFTKRPISLGYIAKVILAFIFIFILGAIYTLALECLPLFIHFIQSLM